MPTGEQRQTGVLAAVLATATALSGCGMTGGQNGPLGTMAEATRSTFGFLGRDDGSEAAAATAPATPAAGLDPQMQDGSTSPTITALLERRSVLEPGPLRMVAEAVLAANSRAAESELRAAVLRSEAAQMNWLPRIGPQVSLTSLGDVVSSLVLDTVLYDHGGRVAERDYARADVEVAAIALAEDTNERVLSALELYLAARAAEARADVTAAALSRMERFDYVMAERARAGVSDRAERDFAAQKLARMRADLAADREAAATATAELQAMSARPISEISGLSGVATPDPLAVPLSVMKAEAEAERAVAEARVARAGQLPGLSASVRIDESGNQGGVTAGGEGIGFGTPSTLRAIEAGREAAAREVAEAREGANRTLSQLSGELASLERQVAEAERLARSAAGTYDLYAAQLEAGRHTVMDVIDVFEAKVRAEREAVTLRHEALRARLRLARAAGTLVDGADI